MIFNTPGLYVWRTRELAGYNGIADDEDLEWHPHSPLIKALLTRYPTDVHSPMYEIPGKDEAPRINKSGLESLIAEEIEPVLRVAMIDIDNAPLIKPDGTEIKHPPWAIGGHPGITRATDPAAVVAALRLLYPSAGIYSTKKGLRLVWVLSEPVPVSRGDAFLRWLVATVPGADESCTDWTRCFRLPYVTRDGVPTEPYIDLDPLLVGAVLAVPSIDELERHVPAQMLSTLAHDAADAPASPSGDLWAWILPTSVAGEHLPAMREGKQLADEGERNRTLFQVIRSLAHRLSKHDIALRALAKSNEGFQKWLADTVYAFVYHAVIADTSRGAPTLEEAWNMTRRTAALEAGRWVQRRPALRAIRSEPAPPEPDEPPEDPDDGFTPDPENPILVKIDSTYYVRHHETGEWSFGVDGTTVPAMLRDYQPRAMTGKTPFTVLSGGALTNLYGVVGRALVYEMGLDQTRWDASTRTMRIACCRRADIEPIRHPDVEDWLVAIGGERLDALLDWLATADELTSPTSALYIEGPRDVGKGMFAFALARMYGSAPIPFLRAIGHFNIELQDCPVVWIDEGIEASPRVSAAFRSLITEPHRTIEQKYQPSSRLEGCVRLVICANNPEAIKLAGRHTRDDVDAIKQRIFHLPTDDTAARYLRKLGGRAYTESNEWVTKADGSPGKICEFIRWVQETREVVRGKRLLVEGPPSDYHRRLLASSALSSQVLWAIAEGLLANENKGERSGISAPGITTRLESSGKLFVWVNVSALHGKWKMLISEDTLKPERADVLLSVRSMSAMKKSRKLRVQTMGGTRTVQCWAIDPALVLTVADDFGLAAVDDLRDLLTGEPSAPPLKVLKMPAKMAKALGAPLK